MANTPRSFAVVFTEKETGNIEVTGENRGFAGWELINLLGEKMFDIYNQCVDRDNFEHKRILHTEDGDTVEIKEKSNDN